MAIPSSPASSSPASSSDPSTAPRRPTLDLDDAAALVRELFGLQPSGLLELDGDRDRNVLVHIGENGAAERYVLKIAGPWTDRRGLELQNGVMGHLAGRGPSGLPRPVPLAGQEAASVGEWQDRDGRNCSVRLITFVPGSLMADTRPHTESFLRSLGGYLARLDKALEDFDADAAVGGDAAFVDGRAGRWDLSSAAGVIREFGPKIPDEGRRRLVSAVAERLEDVVAPRTADLPRALIHNDGNDYNVLVDLDDHGLPRVSGLIDFGDMTRSLRVHEPAIAAAYAGLGKEEPWRAAVHVASGYHAEQPLSEAELEVFFDLVRGRLATSVCMAAHQRALEPDNEYLSVSEAPAWASLERLADLHPDLALAMLRRACGFPATPERDVFLAWLEAAAGSFKPLVDGAMDPAPVVDLSVGSPLASRLAAGPDATDPRPLMDHVDRLMEETGADVVLGKYDEPRLVYAAPQFAPTSSGLEHVENRTVHIGIDLFQPAGAPIYAPLDGTLHSFRDNDLDLDYGPTLILRHEVPGHEVPGDEVPGSWDHEGRLVFYTLYGHLDRASLDGKTVGMEFKAGDRLAHLGDETVNGGWAPHLHFQILLRTFGREGEFSGVASPTDRALWLDICPDPSPMAGIRAEQWPDKPWTAEQILGRRREILGRNLSISYGRHLHIVAGLGSYLYDAEGRSYLDAVNNVPHVGHCHPRVVEAGQDQMAVLCTNTRYLHEDLVRYAERLTATFPDPLSVCVFCCTGSEANDLALRMARAHTGKERIVVVDAAYHGHTRQLIDLSPYKFDGPGGAGAPESTYVAPLPCGYRGPHKHDDPEAGAKYAAYVAEACADADEAGPGVAAFICESVLGCGGQVVLPDGYLQAAYAHARAAGAVCMADEVQVGFGRVGTHMWAFETQGVVPDIVTLGKPIGNGHPMSAVITTAEIAESFANGMEYFNTFGGNAVSCRIGSAVLDVIEDEDLQGNAARTGELLLTELQQVAVDHPIVGEVRGLGLFIGVELVLDHETLEPAADEASYIAERMRDHGILISTDGPLHNVLKIKPPLVFGADEARRLARTLRSILQEERIRRVEPTRRA